MKKKIKFSVIIPIYNVEEYLEESILSIINQTIGFKENIQLILVNDGSPDNSEEICLKYKEKYKDNVVYIKQKNAGVSMARNRGLEEVKGEFVNFLDSDDKWSLNSFKEVYNKSIENPDIDIFSCKMIFFDKFKGDHPLNIKYEEEKVINIFEDFDYPQLSSCSVFYRTKVIGKTRYDKSIKYSEDSIFFAQVLFDVEKYMVLKKPVYYYRKRESNSSAIQTQKFHKDYYLVTPVKSYKAQYELSKKKFEKIVKYSQGVMLYDLVWRIFIKIGAGILSEKEEKEYNNNLRDLILEVEDDVIYNAKFLTDYQRYLFLSYKYKNKLEISLSDDGILINNYWFSMDAFPITINTIKINGDKLELYGNTFTFLNEIYINQKIKMENYELDESNSTIFTIDTENRIDKIGVKISIDLNNYKDICFYHKFKNGFIKLKILFTYRALLNNVFASLYLRTDNYYVKYNKKDSKLTIIKKNIFNKIKLESKCIFNIVKYLKLKMLIVRVLSNIYSVFNKKEIWMLSDRLNIAGDNGEAFFTYLMENNKGPKKKYFTISQTSGDYKRLKEKYGKNIISFESLKYKILFLNSSKIISAHADDFVINRFGKNKIYVSDMFKYKFVFLQHGIAKDDLSPWLNINNINIDMFVTSAKMELESMYKFKYNYDKNIFKLTGLSRFDLLNNNINDRTIVLMPTWRTSLAGMQNPKTGERVYNEEFVKSDYFKFYNRLINDKRLVEALKTNKYRLRFIPHNNMLVQLKDFDRNDYVDIIEKNISYKNEFSNNSLLITDYSSVFFDFGYLKKPIIYTQFDPEDFYKGQLYKKGYFEYEKDGFGPVCRNYESSIKEIIKYIENDCKIEKKYIDRINKFFKYTDRKNCERIYDEIISLDK